MLKNEFRTAGVFLVANLLDASITYLGAQEAGIREVSPVYRRAIGRFGLASAMGIRVLVAVIILALMVILAQRWSRAWLVLRIVNVVVCLTVFWNVLLTILV